MFGCMVFDLLFFGLELLFGLIGIEYLIDPFRFTFESNGSVISSRVGDLLVMTFEAERPFLV